jgi:hypothetical protein
MRKIAGICALGIFSLGLLSAQEAMTEAVHARQEIEKRQFESRFSGVVKAMNDFIARYNDGKGMVWPQAEADKLGHAMRGVIDAFDHKGAKCRGDVQGCRGITHVYVDGLGTSLNLRQEISQ